MALSETAHLAVQLDLQGNITSGLAKAEAGLARFGTAAGRVGGALSHAKTAIGGLISGPLGLLGLTGGLLTAGGAIKSTLDRMNDLAFGTEKLTALTGDSAQTISTLIAASEKYGVTLDKLTVTAGFYEKAVGKLEVTGKLTDFQKEFGVALTDNTGKALGFSEALLSVADVFATSTDEAKNATLAAALFGRSYTGLIPVLALGRQGILDLEKEAASMGLQLSDKNVADFAKYRAALRSSQEAISGLEVAIGEDLLPTITELAQGVSRFVTEHKTDIVSFFHNAVAAAKDAAKTVIGFGQAVAGAWNAIPAGVRDLLTKGLIADRTVKFLFGFDPAGSLLHGLESGLANAFGKSVAAAGIGKLFVQPVFVTNPGFGLGGLPAAGEALVGTAEAAAATGAAVTIGSVIASIIAGGGLALIMAGVGEFILNTSNDPTGAKGRITTATARGLDPTGVDAGTRTGGPAVNAIGAAAKQIANAADDWKDEAHRFAQTINAGDKDFREAHAAAVAANSRDYALTAGRDVLLKEIRDASIARYGGTGLGNAAVEATYQHRLIFAAERIATNGQSEDERIGELTDLENQLVQKGDTKTRARIDALIAKVQAQKPPVVILNNNISASGYVLSTTTRLTSVLSSRVIAQ